MSNKVTSEKLPITLLEQISSQIGLDSKRKSLAENYLSDFIDHDETWTDNKSESAVKCAILAASKSTYINSSSESSIQLAPVSLNALLSGSLASDIQTFVIRLKEFIKAVNLDDQPRSEIHRIISNFAFSLTLFNKFKEIWNALQISGPDDIVEQIKDMTWIIYILSKINLLQRRTEIIECACMMLGTLQFMLMNLSSEISTKAPISDQDACLKYLCGLLRAQPEQVNVSASHVMLMIEKFKEHQVIRGNQQNSRNIEGIFSSSHIQFNLQSLNLYYIQKLLPDDFDERSFLSKPESLAAKALSDYSIINNGNQRFVNQRVIEFEDNDQISINLKLQDILRLNNPVNSPRGSLLYPLSTPMTSAIELETWLNSHTDELNSELPHEIKSKLGTETSNMVKNLLEEFKINLEDLLERYGLGRSDTSAFIARHFNESTKAERKQTNLRVEMTLKLFYKALGELMKIEERQLELRSESRDNYTNVLRNESFYRALLSCCLQTILFVYNTLTVDFEEVLALCKITAFDFWKLMKNFIDFDPKIPTSIRHYFKVLEMKIISFHAWRENSPIHGLIKQHLDSKESTNHPAVLIFYRRFLVYCVNRVVDLSNLFGLQDQIKEEIWTVLKSVIIEAIEMLVDRQIDQIISCTIYGVCKAKSLNITFNTLISKYMEFYNDSGTIFRQVRLSGTHNFGDIIKFYNEVYLRHMKTHLRSISRPLATINIPQNQPISLFSQNIQNVPSSLTSYYHQSPSRNLSINQSPLVSPFATPSSRRLYAFGESPASTLNNINYMMKKTDKQLNFDEDEIIPDIPTKRPRHVSEIFEDPEEISMNLPDEFPGFKDK
ncbi:unnamed protein product [Blepharisma stoltei]|uniref:Uncharacterized protein n=1 Tax=Blepharisma stoltei TaxID=1481888 RepID=A0AAU9J3C2_9CILI|nr:unnamed protein product [Blepharisma stoltei]